MSFSKKMKFRATPVVLLIAITALIVVVTFSKVFMRPDPTREPVPVESPVEQSESWADSSAPMPRQEMPLARTQPASGAPGSAQAGESGDINAEILKLDSRFRGESREPKWAGATEAGINSAIVGSKTDGFDVPPPDSLRVECRTSLCNVRMGYADVDDAAQMQAKLMLGIPASVAQARTFLIDGKNGGTELIIFAGNTDNLR